MCLGWSRKGEVWSPAASVGDRNWRSGGQAPWGVALFATSPWAAARDPVAHHQDASQVLGTWLVWKKSLVSSASWLIFMRRRWGGGAEERGGWLVCYESFMGECVCNKGILWKHLIASTSTRIWTHLSHWNVGRRLHPFTWNVNSLKQSR